MDPDQKPSDLDLQCFQKRINPGSAGQGLMHEHGQGLIMYGSAWTRVDHDAE